MKKLILLFLCIFFTSCNTTDTDPTPTCEEVSKPMWVLVETDSTSFYLKIPAVDCLD